MGSTRISKLKGFGSILVGRDLAGILKDGHVYRVSEACGEIILTDLGEHALVDGYEGMGLYTVLSDGNFCVTQGEYEYKKLNTHSLPDVKPG